MSSIRPLSGITVIEIGHSVAAPYAGMILGELGAEVIKVENPKGGDACRGWARRSPTERRRHSTPSTAPSGGSRSTSVIRCRSKRCTG
jgi:crotonobetainyl-CoA:carnitine CoA-transferase CaiB-like acyl-CoA transferase